MVENEFFLERLFKLMGKLIYFELSEEFGGPRGIRGQFLLSRTGPPAGPARTSC